MGFALNLFIVASILEAQANPITLPIGLSDNATQVLTGWGGGIIGVVGALVGLNVGRGVERRRQLEPVPELDDDEESMP
jgi:hypothetical protein